MLRDMCDDGTVILDDANPLELSKYIIEKKADLFIGGVKERPIAYKMGIGFCDHNHERKIPLAGFAGMLQFVVMVTESDAHLESDGAFLDAADEQVGLLLDDVLGQFQGVGVVAWSSVA